MTIAALLTAVALAAVSAFFGIIGMTAIFAAAVAPIMVMVAALAAAKLVTCAWLARHWRVTPLLLRVPLTVMVLALMTLTLRFLSKAHLQHQIVAGEAVDRNAAPIAQRIELAGSAVADLDGRIARLDAMVKAATMRGYQDRHEAGRPTASVPRRIGGAASSRSRAVGRFEGAASRSQRAAGPGRW